MNPAEFWIGASFAVIVGVCSLFAVLWFMAWRTTKVQDRIIGVQKAVIDFQARKQQLGSQHHEEIARAFAKAVAQEPTYVQPTSRRTH